MPEAAVETAAANELFRDETIAGHRIRFRRQDAFGSLTDLCEIYGRRPNDFLKNPSTKKHMRSVAAAFGVLPQNTVTTHHNGSHRGTWIHPYLLVYAAQWADEAFGVACLGAIIALLGPQAKQSADGDLTLPVSTEALGQAVAGLINAPAPAPALSPAQYEQLHGMVVEMNEKIAFLETRSQRRDDVIRGVIEFARVGQNKTNALYDEIQQKLTFALPSPDESAVLPAPVATPSVASVPQQPDPNVYDVTRPSLQRMRELIGERVRSVAKREGGTLYGRTWRRFYDLFLERTGVNVRTRNRRVNGRKKKGGTHVGYIEDLGLLPAAFELSLEFVV